MSTNCCYCGEELWGGECAAGVCALCLDLQERMREPEGVSDDEPADSSGDVPGEKR